MSTIKGGGIESTSGLSSESSNNKNSTIVGTKDSKGKDKDKVITGTRTRTRTDIGTGTGIGSEIGVGSPEPTTSTKTRIDNTSGGGPKRIHQSERRKRGRLGVTETGKRIGIGREGIKRRGGGRIGIREKGGSPSTLTDRDTKTGSRDIKRPRKFKGMVKKLKGTENGNGDMGVGLSGLGLGSEEKETLQQLHQPQVRHIHGHGHGQNHGSGLESRYRRSHGHGSYGHSHLRERSDDDENDNEGSSSIPSTSSSSSSINPKAKKTRTTLIVNSLPPGDLTFSKDGVLGNVDVEKLLDKSKNKSEMMTDGGEGEGEGEDKLIPILRNHQNHYQRRNTGPDHKDLAKSKSKGKGKGKGKETKTNATPTTTSTPASTTSTSILNSSNSFSLLFSDSDPSISYSEGWKIENQLEVDGDFEKSASEMVLVGVGKTKRDDVNLSENGSGDVLTDGEEHVTLKNGANVSFLFRGISLTLLGSTSPDQAKFTVRLDKEIHRSPDNNDSSSSSGLSSIGSSPGDSSTATTSAQPSFETTRTGQIISFPLGELATEMLEDQDKDDSSNDSGAGEVSGSSSSSSSASSPSSSTSPDNSNSSTDDGDGLTWTPPPSGAQAIFQAKGLKDDQVHFVLITHDDLDGKRLDLDGIWIEGDAATRPLSSPDPTISNLPFCPPNDPNATQPPCISPPSPSNSIPPFTSTDAGGSHPTGTLSSSSHVPSLQPSVPPGGSSGDGNDSATNQATASLIGGVVGGVVGAAGLAILALVLWKKRSRSAAENDSGAVGANRRTYTSQASDASSFTSAAIDTNQGTNLSGSMDVGGTNSGAAASGGARNALSQLFENGFMGIIAGGVLGGHGKAAAGGDKPTIAVQGEKEGEDEKKQMRSFEMMRPPKGAAQNAGLSPYYSGKGPVGIKRDGGDEAIAAALPERVSSDGDSDHSAPPSDIRHITLSGSTPSLLARGLPHRKTTNTTSSSSHGHSYSRPHPSRSQSAATADPYLARRTSVLSVMNPDVVSDDSSEEGVVTGREAGSTPSSNAMSSPAIQEGFLYTGDPVLRNGRTPPTRPSSTTPGSSSGTNNSSRNALSVRGGGMFSNSGGLASSASSIAPEASAWPQVPSPAVVGFGRARANEMQPEMGRVSYHPYSAQTMSMEDSGNPDSGAGIGVASDGLSGVPFMIGGRSRVSTIGEESSLQERDSVRVSSRYEDESGGGHRVNHDPTHGARRVVSNVSSLDHNARYSGRQSSRYEDEVDIMNNPHYHYQQQQQHPQGGNPFADSTGIAPGGNDAIDPFIARGVVAGAVSRAQDDRRYDFRDEDDSLDLHSNSSGSLRPPFTKVESERSSGTPQSVKYVGFSSSGGYFGSTGSGSLRRPDSSDSNAP